MKKNKISTIAARRALVGLISVALVGGGLTVVPAAVAQDAAGQCSEQQARHGNGQGEVTLDKETYKFGDVVTVSGTGFVARPGNGFLALKINSNASEWPKDQSAGDGLEYDLGAATTLNLPAGKYLKSDGSFTVKVVLPGKSDKFSAGTQIITVLGGNDGGPTASRSISLHVNETGVDTDPCGSKAGQTPAPSSSEAPAPAPSSSAAPAPAPSSSAAPAPAPSSSAAPAPSASKSPSANGKSDTSKLQNLFKEDKVRKIVVAVASVLGIAGLAVAVLGSLARLNLIPSNLLPPQLRF